LEGINRNTLLGIAQIIRLRELTLNRTLDQLDPTSSIQLGDKRHTVPLTWRTWTT